MEQTGPSRLARALHIQAIMTKPSPDRAARRPIVALGIALLCLALCAVPVVAALDRSVLWRVVQACMVNKVVTGAAFPCLDVDRSGFVVLRPPLEATHVVVMPTRHVMGVEDTSLQSGEGPNLFAVAWDARHYVATSAPRPLDLDDVALAINSQPGRTQDQLHIHVDCVRAQARDALFRQAAAIGTAGWTPLRHLLAGGRYQAILLPAESLAAVNVFRLAASGLKLRPDELHKMTIAVIGAAFHDGRHGVYVLAGRTDLERDDAAQGENLLDHTCRA